MTEALQCQHPHLHLRLQGRSSSGKRSPLQNASIDTRQKLRDATLQMMQPPSGYSLRV